MYICHVCWSSTYSSVYHFYLVTNMKKNTWINSHDLRGNWKTVILMIHTLCIWTPLLYEQEVTLSCKIHRSTRPMLDNNLLVWSISSESGWYVRLIHSKLVTLFNIKRQCSGNLQEDISFRQRRQLSTSDVNCVARSSKSCSHKVNWKGQLW